MIYRFGQLFDIIDGDRGKSYPGENDFSDEGYCLFLNAGNVTKTGWSFENCSFISEEKDKQLRNGRVQKGNTVLTTRGTVGNAAYYGDNVPFDHLRINSGMVILSAKDNAVIDNEFIYYLVTSPIAKKTIELFCSGSAQPQLPIKDFVKIKFDLPSIPKQRQIVAILSAYDNLIEVNNKRIKALEQMAENLYKEWFVRFRFPGHETTEFDNRIPKGWKYIKLKEISSFQYGKMPSQDHIVDEGYPIYTGYRVSGYYDSFMFDKPMLLVIARGVGGTGEVRISPPEAFITNLSIVFLLNNPDLTKYFLYQLFQIQDLRYLDSGAAQSQITIEDLQRVRILLPDDNLLIQYNKVYLPITNEIQILKEKNINLMKQREMLLPRLMCGKLEV